MDRTYSAIVAGGILFLLPVIFSSLLLYYLKPNNRTILAFGSAITLTFIFMELIPEIYRHSDSIYSPAFMLIGIFVSIVLDKLYIFKGEHTSDMESECWRCDDPFALGVSAALSLHYLVDGFLLGGFIISADKDEFATSSILASVHKTIEGFILYMIFREHDKLRSIIRISLLSSFNLVGLGLSLLSVSALKISDFFSPIVGGMLIYIAIHDFVPMIRYARELISFLVGTLISLIVISYLSKSFIF